MNYLKKFIHTIRYPIDRLRRKYTRTSLGRANRFSLVESPLGLRIATHREVVRLFRPRTTSIDRIQVGLSFATTSLSIFLALLLGSNLPAYASQVNFMLAKGDDKAAIEQIHQEEDILAANLVPETASTSQMPVSQPQLLASGAPSPSLSIPITPPDNRIVIPKIGQNIPIRDISPTNLLEEKWDKLEKDIQEALKSGAVHYPGTAIPGQRGNVFITGHSSYYLWDPGKYKDVFALLHNMEIGDEVFVVYNQQKFRYVVEEKKVIKPNEVDVLKQTADKRLTLMTCTPIGTALNRLIIVAKQADL